MCGSWRVHLAVQVRGSDGQWAVDSRLLDGAGEVAAASVGARCAGEACCIGCGGAQKRVGCPEAVGSRTQALDPVESMALGAMTVPGSRRCGGLGNSVCRMVTRPGSECREPWRSELTSLERQDNLKRFKFWYYRLVS
ncbi:hypothetical protein GCM10010317_057610 [Streptomyces mirabilis]|nr:hypothetical protein GCM10010317_057610 [Streptomyces mirabilis]